MFTNNSFVIKVVRAGQSPPLPLPPPPNLQCNLVEEFKYNKHVTEVSNLIGQKGDSFSIMADRAVVLAVRHITGLY